MWLSMGASMIAFVLNMACSFFLTPYLIRNVGKAEYSFFPLAASFVSYISIVTVALNSMAGRFVTIAMHRQQIDEAREYFNAVFFSSVVFTLIMLPLGGFFIYRIDHFLQVPPESLYNIQILFWLVLVCLLLGQLGSVLNIATYYKDKLYLTSFAQAVGYVVKVGSAVLLFSLLTARIYYVGVMSVCVAITTIAFNFFYTRCFLPEMTIGRHFFRLKRIWELVSSGVWNSISQLSNILLGGLDLLIANKYLGPETSALIAVSKTIPHNVLALLSAVGHVFQPRYARQYALDKHEELVESVKSSMQLIGVLACCPIGFLLALGMPFYHLWVPSMDAMTLQILSILGIGVLLISISIQPVYGIFVITNKVKVNSLVVLGTGVLNVGCVVILLHFTEGQFARMLVIVGVSTVIGILRNLFFTLPYASMCLGIPFFFFYKTVGKILLCFLVCTAIYFSVSKLCTPTTWVRLLACGFGGSIINVGLLWQFVLTKAQRQSILATIRAKLGR